MSKNGKDRKTSGKNSHPGHDSKMKPEANARKDADKYPAAKAPKRNEENDKHSAKKQPGQSSSGHSSPKYSPSEEEERDERTD